MKTGPCVLMLLIIAMAQTAQAQSGIRGRVFTADSTPIGAVSIVVSDSSGVNRWRGVSDKAGMFSIRLPTNTPGGVFFLSATMLGYRDIVSMPILMQKEKLALAVIRMDQQAIAIEPLKVVAYTIYRKGRLEEYFDRADYVKRTGIGHVLDKETLAKFPNRDLPFVVGTQVPGARFERIGSGETTVNAVLLRPMEADELTGCIPALYLDGTPVDIAFLETINADELEGVEVYVGLAQAPVQYQSILNRCGVILAWRAEPKRREGKIGKLAVAGFVVALASVLIFGR